TLYCVIFGMLACVLNQNLSNGSAGYEVLAKAALVRFAKNRTRAAPTEFLQEHLAVSRGAAAKPAHLFHKRACCVEIESIHHHYLY
ncbi:MAG: hypothetical protein K2X81_27345, partial [Candidatus Obscuribacterales bacterium]|nr:hypothetical protein [Candidatus Obscuribacterales bacterium]